MMQTWIKQYQRRTCECRVYVSPSAPSPSRKISDSLSVNSSRYGDFERRGRRPSSSMSKSTLSSSKSLNPMRSSSSRASVFAAALTAGSSEKARCGRFAAWSASSECRISSLSRSSSSLARARVLIHQVSIGLDKSLMGMASYLL